MKSNSKLFLASGWVIALLNFAAVLNSSYFFLVMQKFPVTGWLAFNACAPSIMIFLVGFFFKSVFLRSASIPFLTFFGGGGLILFGWNGPSLIAQISHFFMVLAVVWIAVDICIRKSWKKAAAGAIIGLFLFALIIPFQQNYVKSHSDLLQKLGDPKFSESINKKG